MRLRLPPLPLTCGPLHYRPLASVCGQERKAFQSGRKRIAIITDAGATGASLHADKKEANQQPRLHICAELGWSAARVVQSFGRTHRTNQACPPECARAPPPAARASAPRAASEPCSRPSPHTRTPPHRPSFLRGRYCLLTTECAAEKRCAAVIAKRLESLGALTKGDRRAATGEVGLFGISAGVRGLSAYEVTTLATALDALDKRQAGLGGGWNAPHSGKV